MKKWSLCTLMLCSAVSFNASADIIGATAGIDFWYADAKVNDVRADDAKVQFSAYAALEHFIPLVPNAKIRYTGIKSSRFNTDFQQYDLIAYYELLDNSLMFLDVGINLQHYTGTFNNASFSEWQPNLYGRAAIGIPTLPLSAFASFSAGEFDKTKTVDAEAGIAFSIIDLLPVTLDIKAGYRIIDHDFNYFPNQPKARIINDGFFLGVELDI